MRKNLAEEAGRLTVGQFACASCLSITQSMLALFNAVVLLSGRHHDT